MTINYAVPAADQSVLSSARERNGTLAFPGYVVDHSRQLLAASR